jgi:hypothetical protein
MTRSTSYEEFENDIVDRILVTRTPQRKSMILDALAKHVQKYPDVLAPGAAAQRDNSIPQSEDL